MAIVDDATLRGAAQLTGREVGRVLHEVVQAAGGRIGRHRVVQVLHDPGRSVLVRVDAEVAWATSPPRPEVLLVLLAPDGPPPGALAVASAAGSLAVWRHPHDPLLPGLAVAAAQPAPPALRRLVGHAAPNVEVVAYRPGSRAVVRVGDGDRSTYVKVVPPGAVPAIVARHERIGATGLPVAPVIGVDAPRGLVALAGLPGTPLAARLRRGTRIGLPPAGVLALVDAFAAVPVHELPGPASRPRAPGDALRSALAVLDASGPWPGGLDPFRDLPAPAPPVRKVTVHGDLHPGQLLLRRDGISGVLDLDGTGAGDPADDLARLGAHLLVRTARRPSRAAEAERFVDGLAERWPLAERLVPALVGVAAAAARARRGPWRHEVGTAIAVARRRLGAR